MDAAQSQRNARTAANPAPASPGEQDEDRLERQRLTVQEDRAQTLAERAEGSHGTTAAHQSGMRVAGTTSPPATSMSR